MATFRRGAAERRGGLRARFGQVAPSVESTKSTIPDSFSVFIECAAFLRLSASAANTPLSFLKYERAAAGLDAPAREVVRDIFSTLSGANVTDFDEADFSVLPPVCQLSASFGLSRSIDDIDLAVEIAWPHPVGALPLDALVVVRANGLEMMRFREIQRRLRSKMNDTSSVFISVSQSSTLPHGMVSITTLAIAPPNQSVAAIANSPFSHHGSENQP